jgi:hypothetical protein
MLSSGHDTYGWQVFSYIRHGKKDGKTGVPHSTCMILKKMNMTVMHMLPIETQHIDLT